MVVDTHDKKIPEGYKLMEMGVIPEDWEVVKLCDAVEFLDGRRKPVKSSERAKMQGIYPYYGASGIVDFVNSYLFDGEYILLGEDGENILSRNLPLAFKVKGKIWVNNHAHVMQPNINFNIDYLTAFLESIDYSLLNSGTAQPKLNKQTCLKIKVVKPNKEEQTAIASVLSGVDTLTEKLEKLIAKKRAIKQGTMQELLTGKRRLPGFGEGLGYKQTEVGVIPEDWEVKYFHNVVAKFIDYRGVTPKKLGMDWGDGDICALSANNVQMGYIDFNKECYLASGQLYKRWMRNGDCDQGDILLTMEAPLGNVAFIPNRKKYILSQRTILIKPFEFIEKDFLRYLMTGSFFQRCLSDNASGSTAQGIQRKRLENITIYFPKSKSEQTAIASVLSDMDIEIELLEKKLSKYRLMKQGMMQVLLTGKIRLVTH